MAFDPSNLIHTDAPGDCEPCNGTGESSPGWDCSSCGGTGFAGGGHCDGCGELADDCTCVEECDLCGRPADLCRCDGME